MVNVGVVGMGFMGVTHFKALGQVRGGRAHAIVSRDEKKRQGDWRSIQGNFGGSGGVQDLGRVSCYETLQELLADPSVDLVDICLPTQLHGAAAMQALAAGKHVLVEKPLTLDLQEADRILAAAERAGRQVMVAHVLRYFPEFRLIRTLMDAGEHGRVLAARFRRIIARPAWSGAGDAYRNETLITELHIHDTNFIQFLFGMPRWVVSTGCVDEAGAIEHIDTHYDFGEGGPMVTAEAGWLVQQGCPFEHGYDVYFEDATLKYNSSWGGPPQLLTSDGKTRKPRLPGKDGFVGELQEAVDAARRGQPSAVLDGRIGRDSLLLCLREVQSVRSGRRVRL
ncbi:MAG: Gfo/Idh/MocA family oxidoreductase [Candidatus Latescibacterota bacterium]